MTAPHPRKIIVHNLLEAIAKHPWTGLIVEGYAEDFVRFLGHNADQPNLQFLKGLEVSSQDYRLAYKERRHLLREGPRSFYLMKREPGKPVQVLYHVTAEDETVTVVSDKLGPYLA